MDMLKDARFDFTMLENKVVRDIEKFGKNEILAYVALSSFADKTGSCFPSYESIAMIMRTSRRTAIDAVNGLVEKGVIQVENRKTDEKKKEMTSNLYTLVCCDAWDVALAENRKFMLNRKVKYNKIVAKSKATKVANILDKKNKSECESDLLETNINTNKKHNECFLDTSIPSSTIENQQENSDNLRQKSTKIDNDSENVKILKSSDLLYVRYEKDAELIDSLNTKALIEAIKRTDDKACKPNWNYCLKTYKDVIAEMENGETTNVDSSKYPKKDRPQVNTRFHNINQSFKKYAPQELEQLLQESQKGKFDNAPIGDNYKKTGFHNFDETFTKYTPNEFDELVEKNQQSKFTSNGIKGYIVGTLAYKKALEIGVCDIYGNKIK